MPLAAIAAIGVAGSIGGAAIASHGASSAANTQAAAADRAAQLQYQASQEALAFQKQQFAQQQADMLPWLQSGAGALANLNYLMGITPATGGPGAPATGPGVPSATYALQRPPAKVSAADVLSGNYEPQSAVYRPLAPSSTTALPAVGNLSASPNTNLGAFGSLMQPFGEQFQAPTGITEQNDPGFQARLKLGTDALERSAAAKGGVLTGGTAKALDTYAQDYASNEYGNVYNRAYNDWATKYNAYNQNQTNQYNRLASLAGVGQQTAQQLGMLGQNAANGVSSNLLNTASNMGQQYNNAAAANASGYVGSANAWANGIGGATNSVMNTYLMNQLLGKNQSAPVGWGSW